MVVSICCSKYRCTWKLGPITWDGSTAEKGYLEWTYLTPECAHKWRLHLLHTKVNLGTLPIIWVTKKREGFGRISKVSMWWVPRKITACMPLLIQTSRNHRVAFFTTSSWVRGALGGREEPSGKPLKYPPILYSTGANRSGAAQPRASSGACTGGIAQPGIW